VPFVCLVGAPAWRERSLARGAHLVLDLRAPGRVHRPLLHGFVPHDEEDGHDSDYGYRGSYE
jgi:hypothetical protein